MPRSQRFFSADDRDVGLTRSQLKRASRQRQLAYMRHWFNRNYEDPVVQTPYDGEVGDYLYVWGGPYDAHEELSDQFGSLIPDDRIAELVTELERDGQHHWAPGPDHPNQHPDQEVDPIVQAPDPAEALKEIIEALEAGAKPRYGDLEETALRAAIIERLDRMAAALVAAIPQHGAIGHNRPPPQDTVEIVSAVRESEAAIRRELVKAAPDALQVATAAATLANRGPFGKRVDIALDEMAKSLGNSAGKAMVWGVGALFVLGSPLKARIDEAIAKVTKWLSYITWPF